MKTTGVALFVVIVSAGLAEPVSHGPREPGVEVLEELVIQDGKIMLRVGSNGTTSEASFKVDVCREKELLPRSPHYVVTFRRTRSDEGKAIVADGALLKFDIENDLGITGLYTLTVTNPIVPQAKDVAMAKVLFWKELMAATIQAIDLEVAGVSARLQAAQDADNAGNVEKFRKQKDDLQQQRARFQQLHPADYMLPAAKPASPEELLRQAAGPIVPPRKVTVNVTLPKECTVGTVLEVDGMTRSGPFYHVAGIARSTQRELVAGKHLQLTLFLVFKRDYFGRIPNYHVCITDAKALPALTPTTPPPPVAPPKAELPHHAKPVNRLKIGDSRFESLGRQVEFQKLRPTTSLLFSGHRPEGDVPGKDVAVIGQRQAETDWLLQQDHEAIWVCGLPEPPAGSPVVVHGNVADLGGKIQLRALHLFKDAGRFSKEARPLKKGEYLFLGLSDSKSRYDDVQIQGDSIARCHQSRSCIVFEAVQPGRTTVTISKVWSMNVGAEPEARG